MQIKRCIDQQAAGVSVLMDLGAGAVRAKERDRDDDNVWDFNRGARRGHRQRQALRLRLGARDRYLYNGG